MIAVTGAGQVHVAESLRRGQRVLVAGRIVTRGYDTDGDTRWVTKITAEEVCPSPALGHRHHHPIRPPQPSFTSPSGTQ